MTFVVSIPIRQLLLGERLTTLEWLNKIVTFANYGWYVEMYIGLFLLSPLVNLALEHMTEPKQLLLAAGTLAGLTALPSITALNIIPDYWTSLYPVTYYVIGAVIRRLQPKLPRWICFGGVALLAMGLGFATLITSPKYFNDGFGQGYGGFWTTIMVTLLFLGFYQVRVERKAGKILAWMAGGCFEGYILSRLLDVWVYALLPQWHAPEKYPLLFVCVTIPIFILSLLAGKGVNSLTGLLMKQSAKTPVTK
jgi:surface polysaccharide O-acyltransferase-like enzyme